MVDDVGDAPTNTKVVDPIKRSIFGMQNQLDEPPPVSMLWVAESVVANDARMFCMDKILTRKSSPLSVLGRKGIGMMEV